MRSNWCFLTGIALLVSAAGVQAADIAHINVRVPEFADVWVAGEKTHLTGPSRDFVTPELDGTRRSIYDIRARWIEDGVVIDVTRKIPVRGGDNLRVDFNSSMPRSPAEPVATRRAGEVVPAQRPSNSFYIDVTEEGRMPQNAAMINVLVPANAEVWLSGEKQHQGGTTRRFMTKSLDPDKDYTAEVHAKWKEDGLQVDQTRKVNLHPGDRITVDFNKKAKKPVDDNP